MEYFEYKGKHAELCRALDEHKTNEALTHIYAFFRSEDNTDSYSIPALTAVRELLEDEESAELSRIRIRMRANGDKMLLTLAQFMWAFHRGGYAECAEELADKLYRELEKLTRSIKEYIEEEGTSRSMEIAGVRSREATDLLSKYYLSREDFTKILHCSEKRLEMTRFLMPTNRPLIASSMLETARSYDEVGRREACAEMCREILENYGSGLNASDDEKIDAICHDAKELLERRH